MKKQKLYLMLLLLLGTGLSLSAQSKGGVVPASGSMEKDGSDVFVSYVLTVEREAVSSCRTIYITPQISGKAKTLSFPPVIIKGKSRNRAYERWTALNGKQRLPEPYAEVTVDSRRDREIDFSTVVAYEPWMDEAELLFEERVFICGEEESRTFHALASMGNAPAAKPTPNVTESKGTPQPVIDDEQPMVIPTGSKEKEGIAYIAFEQGKSIIRPLFDGNREELESIARVISNIEKDERAKVTAMILTGYASPEGSEIANYRLSKQRTDAVMNYVNSEFGLSLDRKQMKTSSRGEDWEGLRELLEDEYIPYKREVMKIIDADMNLDEKEHRLKAIAGGDIFRLLQDEFFPRLRKTRYQIFYKTNG